MYFVHVKYYVLMDKIHGKICAQLLSNVTTGQDLKTK